MLSLDAIIHKAATGDEFSKFVKRFIYLRLDLGERALHEPDLVTASRKMRETLETIVEVWHLRNRNQRHG